mmetsp:Transcript_89062/g.256801  ORF Transcript_89062/g.256801 Transcript_89062/m.256801 type:complete len:217 (-) Transcript_89062:378-1028(-)
MAARTWRGRLDQARRRSASSRGQPSKAKLSSISCSFSSAADSSCPMIGVLSGPSAGWSMQPASWRSSSKSWAGKAADAVRRFSSSRMSSCKLASAAGPDSENRRENAPEFVMQRKSDPSSPGYRVIVKPSPENGSTTSRRTSGKTPGSAGNMTTTRPRETRSAATPAIQDASPGASASSRLVKSSAVGKTTANGSSCRICSSIFARAAGSASSSTA